jgi:hypothetical protein
MRNDLSRSEGRHWYYFARQVVALALDVLRGRIAEGGGLYPLSSRIKLVSHHSAHSSRHPSRPE